MMEPADALSVPDLILALFFGLSLKPAETHPGLANPFRRLCRKQTLPNVILFTKGCVGLA
jgi:hypothetical protein